MSGLSPIFSMATTGLGIVNQQAQRQQANAQLDAQAQAALAAAERQRQALQLQQQSDARRRQNLLEQASARARASFGARGLSANEGSAGAVLDGLQADAVAQEAEQNAAFGLQMNAVDQGLAQSLQRVALQRPRNLLDLTRTSQTRMTSLLNWGSRLLTR